MSLSSILSSTSFIFAMTSILMTSSSSSQSRNIRLEYVRGVVPTPHAHLEEHGVYFRTTATATATATATVVVLLVLIIVVDASSSPSSTEDVKGHQREHAKVPGKDGQIAIVHVIVVIIVILIVHPHVIHPIIVVAIIVVNMNTPRRTVSRPASACILQSSTYLPIRVPETSFRYRHAIHAYAFAHVHQMGRREHSGIQAVDATQYILGYR
jgi:hypothetical protein